MEFKKEYEEINSKLDYIIKLKKKLKGTDK